MKIVGRTRPRIRFDPPEVALLNQLFDELEETLDPLAPSRATGGDDVQNRLFPAAYTNNPEAADEFRDMTEETLRSERQDRIEACRADLAHAVGPAGLVGAQRGGDVEISDPELVRRWLQVLNDLRLVHGTRLGVTEDDDTEVDPDDPDHVPRLVYYWLSGVQDLLVRSVMP